jgi:PAS domain S-box-containing protein
VLIKYKLTLSFLVVAIVIGSLAILSYYHSIDEAEYLARHEAESIARIISFDITSHAGLNTPSALENPSEVQELILRFRNIQKRDIVVVDTEQKIIADSVPEEIGMVFEHDVNDEVGQTIRDGRIRRFTETSKAYPKGIRSLSMPLDTKKGVRLGAVILEYTPLYDEITGNAKGHANQFLIYFVIALIIASSVGYVISRQISSPLKEMENAAMRMSEGDLAAKVTYDSGDELGTLAKSFNKMVADVNMARDDLLRANTELELEALERSKVQEKLSHSQNYLKSIIEAAADCVMVLAPDCSILEINPAGIEMVGEDSQEKVIGTMLCPIVDTEHNEAFSVFVEQVCDGQKGTLKYTLTDSSGKRKWVESHGVPFRDEANDRTLMLAVTRDITDSMKAEAALKESEEKFRSFFENSTDGIFILDLEGTIIDVNTTANERLGYTKDELLSLHIKQLDPPEHAAKVPERMAQIHEKGSAVFESAQIRKDGTVMPVEVNARIMEHEGRQVFFSVVRDITERKEAERQLRESEARFRGAFENAGVGASMASLKGQFIKVNLSLCEMIGYSEEELLSRTFSDITHPDDIHIGLDAAKKMVAGEINNTMFEKRYVRKDGSLINVVISPTIIRDSDGNPLHFMALFQDITERKKAEDEIKRSLKEKEILLKEIHHRVKNNMAIISSLLQLQARYSKDEKVTQLLRDSQSRISSMALVHEKLYQTKDFSNINFREYVGELVSHLLDTYGKEKGDIGLLLSVDNINLNIDTMIPCGLILNELVTNSLKYAFDGIEKPEIRISFDTNNGRAELVYGDNGIGMPEHIELPSSNSLGLQIVDMLALQLRGSVELKRDGGTEFAISLDLPEDVQS